MTASDVMQIVLMGFLVVVTGIYAWRNFVISKATREQADASVKMAEDMRYARYDTVRPVIDIHQPTDTSRQVGEQMSNVGDLEPEGLSGRLKNIGLGPALDVYSFVKNPFSGGRQHHDFGTLATGEKTYKMNLSAKQADGRIALLAYYKDVYGRAFESSREVSVDKEKGWEIGPL